MVRRVAAAALLASLGCGDPPPVARPEADRPAPRSLVVLYGDAVEVRVKVSVDGAAVTRELGDLPPGDRYTVRSPRGEVGSSRVVGPLPPLSFASLTNRKVTARSRTGEVTGVVADVTATRVAVRTEGGQTALDLPAEIDVDAPGDTPAAVELRARGARGELEVSSWIGRLSWRIGYVAVVDRGRVALQGWLALANNTDRSIAAERIAVSLAASEIGGPTAALVLGRPLDLDVGETVELPLFARPRSARAAVVQVFDPVGDRLDHEGRRPVSRPSYGARRGTTRSPASVAFEVDLDALGRLPGGRISVLVRRDGALVPVGDGLGFADPAQSSEPFEPGEGSLADSGIGRVVVARSQAVTGRRWQEDFSYEPQRRRLIEEIRVELDNRGDQPVEVDVREHLYRGLNWAVVYHNQAGPLSKTASQEIRFDVEVPARSTRLVAYRVAYTW